MREILSKKKEPLQSFGKFANGSFFLDPHHFLWNPSMMAYSKNRHLPTLKAKQIGEQVTSARDQCT